MLKVLRPPQPRGGGSEYRTRRLEAVHEGRVGQIINRSRLGRPIAKSQPVRLGRACPTVAGNLQAELAKKGPDCYHIYDCSDCNDYSVKRLGKS
jgi:hypothetical protein